MAQLARLMDELTNEVNVLVVGTTSQPQMVDPVLRRPGRFEKEVSLTCVKQYIIDRALLGTHSQKTFVSAIINCT